MFNDVLRDFVGGLLIALPFAACFLLGIAAFTDLTSRLIPNWISISLLFLFSLFVAFGGQQSQIWLHYLWAAGTFFGLLPLFALKKIGGGDVKLLAATMLWAGPISGLEFFLLTTVIGGVLALLVISPKVKLFWEWGNVKFGTHGLIEFFPDPKSIPYGIAIASAGCFVISDVYLGHLVTL